MSATRIGAAFLVLLACGGPARADLGLDTLETDDLPWDRWNQLQRRLS